MGALQGNWVELDSRPDVQRRAGPQPQQFAPLLVWREVASVSPAGFTFALSAHVANVSVQARCGKQGAG